MGIEQSEDSENPYRSPDTGVTNPDGVVATVDRAWLLSILPLHGIFLVLTFFVLAFAVPPFREMLTEFGVELPVLTKLVFSLSRNWYLVIPAILVLCLVSAFGYAKAPNRSRLLWSIALLFWLALFGVILVGMLLPLQDLITGLTDA